MKQDKISIMRWTSPSRVKRDPGLFSALLVGNVITQKHPIPQVYDLGPLVWGLSWDFLYRVHVL